MTQKTYRISELTAYAWQVAIKEAAKELNEAFHFNLSAKNPSLVEETADEFGLCFTENGKLTCPEI